MSSAARCIVALGSNLGDSATILRSAVYEIDALEDTELRRVSRLYSTAPVGGPEQADFLNAAVLIESKLSPSELLSKLHQIEQRHARTREVHWGPRTLDLDLIDVEGFQSAVDELMVPHPRARERQFVIHPLHDVAPNWMLGGSMVTDLVRASSDVSLAADFGWEAT